MKRIKRNVITKDNQIPMLSATSKDHKKSGDDKVDPDVRPIMGAMVGPNIGLEMFGKRTTAKNTNILLKSNQDNIRHNDGKVTIAIYDRKGTITHKNEVRLTDNIKHNDGKVNPVNYDRRGTTAHKNEVRFTDNNKHDDDKVTPVNDDRKGTTNHKKK